MIGGGAGVGDGPHFVVEACEYDASFLNFKPQIAAILSEIDGANMEVVLLEKAPEIAIYAPPNKQPWDDAVMMALEYARRYPGKRHSMALFIRDYLVREHGWHPLSLGKNRY